MSVIEGIKTIDDVFNNNSEFKDVIQTILQLSEMINTSRNDIMNFYNPLRSSDTDFMEYQYTERKIERKSENDRVFPMETVLLQSFADKTGTKQDTVNIHTGAYANEFARSYNALAVTMMNCIFFRNGAYNPGSEEGRRILSHEITHVGQFNEKRITNNITVKELESEARQAECNEEYNTDEYVTVEINGKDFTMLESEMEEYAEYIAEDLKKWAYEQRFYMDEKEYLRFLRSFKKWLDEDD